MLRKRGEKRFLQVVLLFLGVLALFTITIGSLPCAKADTNVSDKETNANGEEGVCTWDDEAGKEKCIGRQAAEEEEEEEEDWEDDDDEYTAYWRKFHEIPEEGEEWDVWKHGGKEALYEALDCDATYEDSTFETIHNAETWQVFNKVYNEVIAATRGDEKLQQESTIPPKFEKHGFQFPIEVKFSSESGRGVFAMADIPEGSLLYTSANNGAFLNGQTYRNFLKALPSPLACDVMIWAFVRWVSLESEENDAHMACVDLDEGSFVNSASEEEQFNMALGNDEGKLYADCTEEEQWELWPGCKMKFYAARDIKAGEEIRASYGDFAEENGWMYLKL